MNESDLLYDINKKGIFGDHTATVAKFTKQATGEGICPNCKEKIPAGTISALSQTNGNESFDAVCPACKKDFTVNVTMIPVFSLTRTKKDIKVDELASVMDDLQRAREQVKKLEKEKQKIAKEIDG